MVYVCKSVNDQSTHTHGDECVYSISRARVHPAFALCVCVDKAVRDYTEGPSSELLWQPGDCAGCEEQQRWVGAACDLGDSGSSLCCAARRLVLTLAELLDVFTIFPQIRFHNSAGALPVIKKQTSQPFEKRKLKTQKMKWLHRSSIEWLCSAMVNTC